MTNVRLNIFAYVMLTMGAFWGAFSGTGAWKFDPIAQFALFAVLVMVWGLGSMAMMTWSGREKAKTEARSDFEEERRRESEALGVSDSSASSASSASSPS